MCVYKGNGMKKDAKDGINLSKCSEWWENVVWETVLVLMMRVWNIFSYVTQCN